MTSEVLEYFKKEISDVKRHYKQIYRSMIQFRLLIRKELYYHDVRRIVMANDAELLSRVVDWMSGYKYHLEHLQMDFLEELNLLIDLAIQAESHECYILLLEYKRSHNLYQDNPFEL